MSNKTSKFLVERYKLRFIQSVEEHTVVSEAGYTLEVHFNLKSNVPFLNEILSFLQLLQRTVIVHIKHI